MPARTFITRLGIALAMTFFLSIPTALYLKYNPPFAIFDEPAHLRRIAEATTLDSNLYHDKDNGFLTYGYTISSYVESQEFDENTNTLASIKARDLVRKGKTDKYSIGFNPAATYSRFAYLPQIAAYWFVEKLDGTVLEAWNLGRVLSGLLLLLVFFYSTYSALGNNNFISYNAFAILASMPMFAYMCTSASADSGVFLGTFTSCIALLELERVIDQTSQRASYSQTTKATLLCSLLIVAALMMISKVIYIPIAIWITYTVGKFSLRKENTLIIKCLFAGSSGIIIWGVFERIKHTISLKINLFYTIVEGRTSGPTDFLGFTKTLIKTVPLKYKEIFINMTARTHHPSVQLDGSEYSTMFTMILVTAVFLALSKFIAVQNIEIKSKLLGPDNTKLLMLSLFASFVGIYFALNSTYNNPNTFWIDGVQGRYFNPLLVFAVLALLGSVKSIPKAQSLAINYAIHRLVTILTLTTSFYFTTVGIKLMLKTLLV